MFSSAVHNALIHPPFRIRFDSGHIVKVKKEGHPDKCAVVIETGDDIGDGLLLSPKFFKEYENLDTGIFPADWNFVNRG